MDPFSIEFGEDVFSLVIFLSIENALEGKIIYGLVTMMPKLAPSLDTVLN
jgi:hypothetical protein